MSARVESIPAWEKLLIWKKGNSGSRQRVLEPSSRQNAVITLTYAPKYRDVFRHDIFADKIIVGACPPWEDPDRFMVHQLNETDVVKCCCAMEVDGITPGKDTIRDAINLSAQDNPVHPPREHFSKLKWDGKHRLKNWLTYYLGAEKQHPDYLSTVGTMWLVSGVARIFDPGCKVDHMMVLEGKQEIGKSTALATLATFGYDHEIEYFTDRISFTKLHDKDTMMMLQGYLIVEFPELASLNNKDFNEVKQWISLRADEARKPYEREPKKYPRQFILSGTTNDSSWLRDPTGNRRFWPVRCGDKLDIDALKKDREQLWAEAIHLYKQGHHWWIDKNSPVWGYAMSEQHSRLIEDIWTVPVMNYLDGKDFVKIDDILKEALFVEVSRQDRYQTMRVGSILRSNGWEETTKYQPITKKSLRGWGKEVPGKEQE